MAQGFKRTGSVFSHKKSASVTAAAAVSKPLRKGARIIQPKRAAALAKANLTHRLTTQLNKRAESALIGRLGGNTEGSLKIIRPDITAVPITNKNSKSSSANKSTTEQKRKGNHRSDENDSDPQAQVRLNSLAKQAMNQLDDLE